MCASTRRPKHLGLQRAAISSTPSTEVRTVPLASKSLTIRRDRSWNCFASVLVLVESFRSKAFSIACSSRRPMSCIFAVYPPKYPAARLCAACKSAVCCAMEDHRQSYTTDFSCVSAMIGKRCGNLISPLSPEKTTHAAGPAFSHGQLRVGSTQPM